MCELYRLEHPTDRSRGGVLFVFREDLRKQAAWSDLKSDTDAVELAKKVAASVLDSLLKAGEVKEAEGTNWVSVVAGVARHVSEAKERLAVH